MVIILIYNKDIYMTTFTLKLKKKLYITINQIIQKFKKIKQIILVILFSSFFLIVNLMPFNFDKKFK